MNSLSWLIYFGELSSSVSVAFGVFAVVTVFSVVSFLMYGASLRESNYKDSEYYKIGVFIQKKSLQWGAIAFPIFLLVSVVLPSKETVYMIAASEAGEQALKTPEFGKLRLVINQYLDEKLNPPKKDK